MDKGTELHPLVSLLVARMESHPEEFVSEAGDVLASRWLHPMEVAEKAGTEEEKRVVGEKLGRLMMDKAHEWTMDELLNGEERRAKEETEKVASMVKQAVSLGGLYGQAGAALATLPKTNPTLAQNQQWTKMNAEMRQMEQQMEQEMEAQQAWRLGSAMAGAPHPASPGKNLLGAAKKVLGL